MKMFDPISGKPRRLSAELSKAMGNPISLAFGPDSRTVAVVRYGAPASIYELASQRELCQLPKSVSIAFSPKGRFIAHAGWKDGIRIHDLATGKTCLTLEGHPGQTEGYAAALAFSRDGTRLISGGRDGVAIIWDVSDLAQIAPLRPDREVNAKALDEWWSELAQSDAKTAHRALWNLVAAGESSIPLLKAKLKTDPMPDAKLLAQFIADLDSNDFGVRARASKELENLGEAAEEPLQRALAKKPPLESARRIEQLLAKITAVTAPPEYLRVTRALSALEQIPGPKGRALLESLAEGPPEARLTRDAQSALQRLAKSTAGSK